MSAPHPLDALEMLLRQCRITGLSNAGTPARFVGFWVRGSARQTCVLASSILSKAHGKQWGSPLLSGDLGKSPLCVFVSSSVKWINNRTYGRIQGLWGLKLKKKIQNYEYEIRSGALEGGHTSEGP